MSSSVSTTNRLHFPAKIYIILENESPDIINWHKNNKGFLIIDHQRFENEIIPKYFRHNQMSSVQRQLNLYGFRCVSRGEDKGCFYHPDFQRGEWEKVKLIRRSIAQPTPYGIQNWKSFEFGKKPANASDKILDAPIKQEPVESGRDKVVYSTYPEANNVLMKTQTNTSIPDAVQTSWSWPPVQVIEQQKAVSEQLVRATSDDNIKDVKLNATKSFINSNKLPSRDSFEEFLFLCDDLYTILDDNNNDLLYGADSLSF